MTTTVPPTYKRRDVPKRGDRRSSHALGISPSGIAVRTAQCANLAYEDFLGELIRELEPLEPEPKAFRLKKIVRTVDAGYAVVDCHREISAVPTRKAVRTGRFSKPRLAGGELLDDFFLGGDSWRQAHDNDIYEAARVHAEAEGARRNDLRMLNEIVLRAILTRAGCPDVRSWDLPL